MNAWSRLLSIFVVLLFGIYLGTLGLKTAFLIITPLFLIWYMLWDEKSYRKFLYKNKGKQQYYDYKRLH